MRSAKILRSGLLVCFLAGAAQADAAPGSPEEKQAVHKAVDQFYSALNDMFAGEVAPMKKVWSHADDVNYMGPDGGFQIGWEKVMPVWEKHAEMKLGGKVEPKDLRIVVGKDLAIASCFEVGQNMTADGKPVLVRIRATNVFRKEDGAWKMIGHHTDLLPTLAK